MYCERTELINCVISSVSLLSIGKKRIIREIDETVVCYKSSTHEKFMFFEKFPDTLKFRNYLTNHLYIRDCYSDMFVDIKQSIPLKQCKVLAVVGTAGIGKSSFFAYCLNEYLKDPSCFLNGVSAKSFYYQTDATELYIFEYVQESDVVGIEFTVRLLEPSENTNSNFPLFADLKSRDSLPKTHLGVTIIFCSFQQKRYKEVTKQGWQKIMPTWSIQEIEDYISSDQFRLNYNVQEGLLPQIHELTKICGGVIRHIIRCCVEKVDPKEKIVKVIEEKGDIICGKFFKTGFGGLEDEISDSLIHRNPLVKEDGSYDYNSLDIRVNFHFASPYVLKEVMKRNNRSLVAQAKQKYAVGTFRGGEDGIEFEMLCFHSFRFSGIPFDVTPLHDTEGLNGVRLTFPDIDILQLDWRTRSNYLTPDVLYLPPYGNLESGDAFCVIKIDNMVTLIVLQSTIAPTHPVKKNGVEVIYDCYVQNSGVAIEKCIIIFVTPVNGKLNTKQKICTKTGDEVKNLPSKIGSVANCQYKLENPLAEFVE